MPAHVWARAGQDIDGILRPTKPFVGQAEGKRRLRTLLFCDFKLRNFETLHRGNATVSVCVRVNYIQTIAIYNNVCPFVDYIILLGVGWLRCLSLERGNAKA